MLLRRLKHRDWGFHASLASETISLDGWMNEGWVDGWMDEQMGKGRTTLEIV